MSGAQGANPPGAQTSTTYSTAPNADTGKTAHKVDSTDDVKGLPVEFAADVAPNPKESAGLGGPVFGANDGPDKGGECYVVKDVTKALLPWTQPRRFHLLG